MMEQLGIGNIGNNSQPSTLNPQPFSATKTTEFTKPLCPLCPLWLKLNPQPFLATKTTENAKPLECCQCENVASIQFQFPIEETA